MPRSRTSITLASLLIAGGLGAPVAAQSRPELQSPADAVVLIAIDGLRWQEVFGGADRTVIIHERGGVRDTAALLRAFWRDDPAERRRLLLPFLWGMVAQDGQLFGDRARGSDAGVTNTFRFSYPGYNEILTGAFDPRINSNDFGPNPNETVFEWLAAQAAFRGQVAAFATWNAFHRIFNAERAALPVYAGWTPPFDTLRPANERQAILNELYGASVRLWPDNAFDAPMYLAAREYVRSRSPRLLFVGFGETDEWAHAGRYDLYLESARQTDAFIADLWRTMQSLPTYAGRTAFVITTDHGRGRGPDDWRDHGRRVSGAEEIWIAVLGAGVTAAGSRADVRVRQNQIAATVAWLLGADWRTRRPDAGAPLPLVP